MQFIRTAWGDFPKVKVLYPLNTLKRASEELYYKAKGGDVIAAYELLFEYVIKQQDIDDFGLMVLNQNPILVPVLAQEHLGKNRIPAVFAEMLGSALGFYVCDDIVQTVKANRQLLTHFRAEDEVRTRDL